MPAFFICAATQLPSESGLKRVPYSFDLTAIVSAACTDVYITKVEYKSVPEDGKVHVPTVITAYPPTGTSETTKEFIRTQTTPPRAIIPGGYAEKSNSNKWEVVVTLSNPEAVCKYPITLGGGCKACKSGTCPAQTSNESGGSSTEFPMTSHAGDNNGTAGFKTPDLSNPGRAGVTASVPSSFTVNRTGGVITSVVSPVTTVEVTQISGHADPNAFTITHKHTSTGTTFRTTTIALDSGYFQINSTFDGTTFRTRQSQPVAGTTLLESGAVVGGTFTALRKETLTITIPQPGTEVHRETVEERPTGTAAFATVSDVQSTWNNYAWGWEMTQQATDPGGANLISNWTYYQPGEVTGPGPSYEGEGRLKSHTRYDGHQETHAYWLNNHQTLLPFAGSAQGLTVSSTYDPATGTHTTTRAVGADILSKETETFNQTTNTRTSTTYTSATGTLTTTTVLKTFGADFGGQPASVSHPDGTLTTYDYTRHTTGGGKVVVMKTGVPSGGAVTLGKKTTTTYNRNGTAIRSVTETIGYTTNITVDHTAVTAVDNYGRALTTASFPTSSTAADGAVQATATAPKWTTATTYSCCGVATSTDRHGIDTTYGYDGLRRQTTSTTLGVTTETVHNGLTTYTHRYTTGPAATGNRISSNSRNLAGTTTSSSSPDPSSTTAGTLVTASSTVTTYQPAAGLATRTVTTVPGGYTQTTDTYLDGRTASTTGDLEPTMTYAYTTNGTGLITSSAYASGNESTATNTDWAGRTVTTTQNGESTTQVYNSLGQLYSVTDADSVRTLSAYNALGERTVSALDIDGDSIIDYNGTDQITVDTQG